MAEQTTGVSAAGMVVSTGNEINGNGKLGAGILLVLFIVLAILALIAYWPDRLPAGKEAVYKHSLFNICLIDSFCTCSSINNIPVKDTIAASLIIDSSGLSARDSLKKDSPIKARKFNLSNKQTKIKSSSLSTSSQIACCKTITLNALLLVLVAIAGFLGSMIHISSSFTNYVGSEKFKRSWILWYVVKPFTGAALAIIIYFVFRAGFFNFNDTSNINLYGLITLAALAGLFADKATLKLEEIFEVIFKPKDQRPDKIDEVQVKIKGIDPDKLFIDKDNNFVISGEGFDKKRLSIKINDDLIINPVIKGDSIAFSYKVPDALTANKEFKMIITDEGGKELYTKTIGINNKMPGETGDEDDELPTAEAGDEPGTTPIVKG